MIKKLIKNYGVELAAGTVILINSLIIKKDIKQIKAMKRGENIRLFDQDR